jgi:hypothetical protein
MVGPIHVISLKSPSVSGRSRARRSSEIDAGSLSSGVVLRAPDGEPLPNAPRTRVCDAAVARFNFEPYVDGAWYRCYDGHIRKLIDCCGSVTTRINGDAALTGYCYSGRRVFCVLYYDTKVPC